MNKSAGLLRNLVITFLALGLSYSSLAQSKVETQAKKAISKTSWKEEPNSFAGVSLIESVNFLYCPMKAHHFQYTASVYFFDYSRWQEMAAADASLTACIEQSDKPSQDINGNPSTQIHTARNVNPLGPIHIITNNEKVIVKLTSYFTSDKYLQLLAIFSERYGPPHVSRQTKLQSNGGAIFEGAVVEWKGRNFDIKLESLIKREYSSYSNTINETGEFTIINKAWLRSKGEILMNDVKDKAKNF